MGRGAPDARDHTLQLDLPDGRYRVACRLVAPEGAETRLSIYANDQRVVPTRRIVGATEAAFEADVRRGLLTLVFHAPSGLLLPRTRSGGARLEEVTLERLGP